MEKIIKFENSRTLTVEIYAVFDLTFDTCRVCVELTGIAHPLDKTNSNYFGEETKNPQLREATDLIEEVFNDWVAFLHPSMMENMELQPMKDSGSDIKDCEISQRGTKLTQETIEYFQNSFELLVLAIEGRKQDIENALISGKKIELTDPSTAINIAFLRALNGLGEVHNIDSDAIERAKYCTKNDNSLHIIDETLGM